MVCVYKEQSLTGRLSEADGRREEEEEEENIKSMQTGSAAPSKKWTF